MQIAHEVSARGVAYADEDTRATFISRVYGLLFVTMVLAAGASVFAFTPTLMPLTRFLAGSPFIAMALYFGLAFGMHAVSRVPVVGPLAVLAFGVFTGLWIAPMVQVMAQTNPSAVTNALAGTAGIFAVMSVFGATTRKDLSGLSAFLMPGLIIVIVMSLVNIFLLGSSLVATALSAVSVLIFSGYLAYDTQNVMQRYPTDMWVSAAASLYLNVFIIFINLLQLLSGRRD
jgi:modulator of FtsH protease